MRKSRNKDEMSICILGLRGYPDGYSAKVSRYSSIVRILSEAGDKVMVVNREFTQKEYFKELDNGGSVKVIGSSRISFNSYTIMKWLKKIAAILEFFAIIKHNKLKKIDIIIVYNFSFYSFCWYYLYAKVFRSKLVFDYVERQSQMDVRRDRKSLKINDYLYEKIGIRMVDGALVISEYLKNEVLKVKRKEKVYKLPPLCNFSDFDVVKSEMDGNFFLYCGSVAYIEVIEFIIESYQNADIGNDFNLVLVLSGSSNLIEKYSDRFWLNAKIKVYTNLSKIELTRLYKSASGLVIPIRPSIQDIARSPQKVSEYSASKRVIISNRVGEMAEIFEHNSNVLFADGYNVNCYSKLFKEIANKKYDLDMISINSYELGKKVFDDSYHQKPLRDFLKSL